MQKFDLLIVGGGMVGLSLALACRKLSSMTIAVVDANPPQPLNHEPELRVSAINAASQTIFENLGVWSSIVEQRMQPYQHMHVWDVNSAGSLDLNIDDLRGKRNRESLGTIIENSVVRQALWQQIEQDQGVTLFTQERIQSLAIGEHEVFAAFQSQSPIMAKLVVGADGAQSWVRQQADMPIAFRDYDNHAVVATVNCEQGHQNTAWQVFLPEGPLAFLPLYNSNQCSIVWSTSPEKANAISSMAPEEIGKELTALSSGKLGRVSIASDTATFPLTMRLAHQFVKDRAVLVGDAAHTIHPLAGQGVNLGLLDAMALAQHLSMGFEDDALLAKQLAQYSRWRRAEAANMVAAMEAIKQIFTPQQPIIKAARGFGMEMLSQLKPVKSKMIEQALGLVGDLPELAKNT
ncbi:FAD-dependent monooxygenase [Thalassotalea euphylliae]|uniref:FAD-dependent monooxygenase n=1 Tax=Thalassotalea euphylliae TaxID=1655234 RepID=UPI00362592EA